MRVGIVGATGRMGVLLIAGIARHQKMRLSSVIYKGAGRDFGEGVIVASTMKELLEACDLVIDFSVPEATEELVSAALETPRALVIGTTGLSAHQHNLIQEAATKMPILYATNMSLGIAMMNRLVALASRTLADFDIEIVEMHHRFKKDAPSGTALTLAHSAAQARGLDLDEVRVSGRNGIIGERSKNEIAVMALRGGDIAGRHTVGFYNDGEYIELTHVATSRETFAQGAIRAAAWLEGRPAGLYSIQDCLGV